MQEQPRPFAAVASSQSSEKLPRAASGFNKPNHLNGKPEYSNTNLLHKSETQAMISRKKSSILSEVGANPIAEISSKPVPKRFIARPIKVSPNIPEVIWRKYFLLSSLNSLYFGWWLPSPDIFVRMAVLLNRTFEPYSKESTMMSIMTADWVKSGLETCSITFRLRMLFCKLYAKSFSRRVIQGCLEVCHWSFNMAFPSVLQNTFQKWWELWRRINLASHVVLHLFQDTRQELEKATRRPYVGWCTAVMFESVQQWTLETSGKHRNQPLNGLL